MIKVVTVEFELDFSHLSKVFTVKVFFCSIGYARQRVTVWYNRQLIGQYQTVGSGTEENAFLFSKRALREAGLLKPSADETDDKD